MFSNQEIKNFCDDNNCCILGYALDKIGVIYRYPSPIVAARELKKPTNILCEIAEDWDNAEYNRAIDLAREIGII